METIISLSRSRDDGAVVFDLVLDGRGATWHRHDFDNDGHYRAVAPSSPREARNELGPDASAAVVVELRTAADELGALGGRLRSDAARAAGDGDAIRAYRAADRADRLEAARRSLLDEIVRACDETWDAAVAGVDRARRDDPDALPGAIREVELLWSARRAVRRLIGRDDRR
ncbi:MAG: hypothetical protein U0T02_09950 [Solirubrobacteraceae bacterium]